MMWTFSLAKFGLSIVGKSPLSDKMKHYFFNAISISSSMTSLRGHWQNNRNRSQMTGIQRCYSESMTATIPYKKHFYHHISCFSHVIRQWRKLVKRTSTQRCKDEIIIWLLFYDYYFRKFTYCSSYFQISCYGSQLVPAALTILAEI